MSAYALVLIYLGMLVFDAALLTGTGWLIAERGWSAWWMLAAAILCTGSNPKYVIATAAGTKASEPC